MLGKRVVKVELARAYSTSANSQGEMIYKVWYENDKYSYVWAKDEIEAYKRAMRDERGLDSSGEGAEANRVR